MKREEAFPRAPDEHPGMSVRTWLAGQAMAGLCASDVGDSSFHTMQAFAESAVRRADAVIAELEK